MARIFKENLGNVASVFSILGTIVVVATVVFYAGGDHQRLGDQGIQIKEQGGRIGVLEQHDAQVRTVLGMRSQE